MNYTTNFNLRLPERNEQFNLDDWNNNTKSMDSAMQTNKTNISNNATNITSILTGLSTVNTSDTSSIYYKLMKLIYPVGSLYWSSKSTNPSSLFGGTWVQIKDRFVLACGDTYTSVGSTGGASSVTLSVSNMPSHTHTFTPSGSVSSHTHGLNNHTHSFTPSGSVSSHRHDIEINVVLNSEDNATDNSPIFFDYAGQIEKGTYDYMYHDSDGTRIPRLSFSNISGPSPKIYYSTTTGRTENAQPTFTGNAGTTGAASGNTASATPTFSGTAGTTSSNGSGTSFSILPPYVVKYCFERTA